LAVNIPVTTALPPTNISPEKEPLPPTVNLLVGKVTVVPIPTLPLVGIDIVPPASTSNNGTPLLSFTRNKVPSVKLSFTKSNELPVVVLAIDNLPAGTEVPIPTEILVSS
jgi:hypothetical protein